MRFVILGEHSPEACPGSSSKVAEAAQQALGRLEELGKKYRVRLLSGDALMPGHKLVMIVEAEGLGAVNRFLLEGGLAQWNSIEVFEGMPFQEAMQLTEELDTKLIW